MMRQLFNIFVPGLRNNCSFLLYSSIPSIDNNLLLRRLIIILHSTTILVGINYNTLLPFFFLLIRDNIFFYMCSTSIADL